MGIASFFPWFSKTFSRYISYVNRGEKLRNVDNLLIDMNGIFHPVAQRVFMYGKYKKPLLVDVKRPTNEYFFEEVGKEIDKIVSIIPPTRALVLCVDGVAPVAKQQQQRQRRYKMASTSEDTGFDPNCLTPGSQIMQDLCKYLYKRQSQKLGGIELIFSSSSVPGEGEMKLMSFIKYYSRDNEVSAVYGLDADIVLLSLCALSGNKKILVVRERDTDHTVIDVSSVKKNLLQKLSTSESTSDDNTITDFVFMCFFVGNDFLKRAPGIDIITGSVDMIIEVYKDTVRKYGHITNRTDVNGRSLMMFLQSVGNLEETLLQIKVNNLSQYIEDPLFNKYIIDGKLNIPGYKKEYYESKLRGVDVETVCEDYLEGLQWVLKYYTEGVPSWKWYYPHNYSPFISDVAMYPIKKVTYGRTVPYDSLYQLLVVLPPKSMNLLPKPLNTLYKEFPDLFPNTVDVDKGGKRHEYEGEVLIKPIESSDLLHAYKDLLRNYPEIVNSRDKSISLLNGTEEIIEL